MIIMPNNQESSSSANQSVNEHEAENNVWSRRTWRSVLGDRVRRLRLRNMPARYQLIFALPAVRDRAFRRNGSACQLDG